jgi:hypothetical protein
VSEKGRQCIQADYPWDIGGEDHGVGHMDATDTYANDSLQRFKMNIASSVVTQQNSGLGSMNTGEVLDLFKVSAEGEGQKKKESKGPVSASKILEG